MTQNQTLGEKRDQRFDLELLKDPDSHPVAHASEWKRLFEHFTPRLDSYFRERVPDVSDREDLISVIWERTVENLHRLDSDAVFWNWFRRVGENRLVDIQRSRTSERRSREQLDRECMSSDTAVDDVLSRLSTDPYAGTGIGPDELRSRYLLLSDPDRAFILLILNDVPHRQIATRLGLVSEQASRQRWKRIRARLRGRP
jgi:DNA-directed RNA polymerase specialized sigma24 family protein